ncbi:MAG TPA: fumarylacetoacetate hydrolase family protein [Bacteroidota bacterium]|nr:fumarylacetoacetate hydrolase family protein [Bacteroidota bacterium]
MHVAQFEDRSGPLVGIRTGKRWINYGKAERVMYMLRHGVVAAGTDTVADLLARGQFDVELFGEVLGFIARERLERFVTVAPEARMTAPLRSPGKIIALGLNYALHAREGKMPLPKEPMIFVKAPSAIIGPGETVRIPHGMGRMDHEVELAVVIGKRAAGVSEKSAWDHIAGYTILNDVTARDIQTLDVGKKHPWFRSKSFDTFCPLGPWIVTADEFRPPVHVDLECRVNGRIRQKANTKNLVFGIAKIISWVSRLIALEPGDIISTGTPEGISPVTDGDVITCRIRGIGELRNPVRWR